MRQLLTHERSPAGGSRAGGMRNLDDCTVVLKAWCYAEDHALLEENFRAYTSVFWKPASYRLLSFCQGLLFKITNAKQLEHEQLPHAEGCCQSR